MNPFGKILLADDDPQDVELILRALETVKLANDVFVVNDGEELLDYLYFRGKFADRPKDYPVVILLDLRMPKVDGFDVLQDIKHNEKLKVIPVIVLTSSLEENDIIRSYNLHANAYVVKPVDFQSFVTALKELGIFWALINQPPIIRE